jgi:hypothetical protein
MGSPGRAAATPGRVEDRDFDMRDRTYIWACRCGKTWERKHERISVAWSDKSGTGVVRAVLGDDM